MMNKKELTAALTSKYRYSSNTGDKTTEQLFELPLNTTQTNRASLQGVAVRLSKEIKELGETDFVGNGSPETTLLTKKLEVVKYVIEYKKEVNAKTIATREKREADRRELGILLAGHEQKEIDKVSNMSDKEIAKRIAELRG